MKSVNKVMRDELVEWSSIRQRFYDFFSAAFAAPCSLQQLQMVRSEAFLNDADELFGQDVTSDFRQYAASDKSLEELQAEGRQEFMNLFRVPGNQYVMPYESVYCDQREVAGKKVSGLLMGPSSVDVQKWYQLAAVDISPQYKDLPDHICLELNYLAHLCNKEQDFIASADSAKLTRAWEMERDFLAGHIVKWISLLRDRIHQKSDHLYFRAIADMVVEFTRKDLARLESVLGKSCGQSVPHYG